MEENVGVRCTACPSVYIHSPTLENPRRCVYLDTEYEIDGVPCGDDTGLGLAWEVNIRMPAIARWKNGVVPVGKSDEMVSTLDVVPTVLSILGKDIPEDGDGVDVTSTFL